MDSAKPIYKYLMKQNSQVVELITHGRAMYQVRESLKPFINQYIGGEWQLGQMSREEITLIVNTAEMANRLRFRSTILLSEIRRLESFNVLKKINIKVIPAYLDKEQNNKPDIHHTLAPSETGHTQLMSLADTVEDQALKESLKRLAGHLQP